MECARPAIPIRNNYKVFPVHELPREGTTDIIIAAWWICLHSVNCYGCHRNAAEARASLRGFIIESVELE